jgi:hypothetical protein
MFPTTQHASEIDLLRISEFQRRQIESARAEDTGAGSTRLSSLNPSLLQDLLRFDEPARAGVGLELIEVMAAAVRHGRALLLQVEHELHVFALTVFPVQRQVHAPLTQEQLLALPLHQLRVLHVEPSRLHPEDEPESMSPLGMLLWELALRGNRDELLPEIGGLAAYRIAPGVDLERLELTGSLAAAVTRLRVQTSNVREMAQWPGFDRERAMRLLNALYLQAGLIVSRTHPAATNDSWFNSRR